MGCEFVRYDIWNGEQGYLGYEWRLDGVFTSFGISALAKYPIASDTYWRQNERWGFWHNFLNCNHLCTTIMVAFGILERYHTTN